MKYEKLKPYLINNALNMITLGFYSFLRENYLYFRLKKAVQDSNFVQILFFLDKGAIVNDLSILKIPVLNKNKIITELLLNNGGEANISPLLADSYDGNYHTFSETHVTYPLLEIAIANEDIEIIKLLLQHGIESYEGLQQALKYKKIKIIILLREKTKDSQKIFYIFKNFFSLTENSVECFYNNLDLNEHLKLDDLLLSLAIYMKKMDTINSTLYNFDVLSVRII